MKKGQDGGAGKIFKDLGGTRTQFKSVAKAPSKKRCLENNWGRKNRREKANFLDSFYRRRMGEKGAKCTIAGGHINQTSKKKIRQGTELQEELFFSPSRGKRSDSIHSCWEN